MRNRTAWTVIVLVLMFVGYHAAVALAGEAEKPAGRFTQAQVGFIVKHAKKADALYPVVGGIGILTSKGRFVLEPFSPRIFAPLGACDSLEECHEAADDACREAGHGGGDEDTTEISPDGEICSEDCSDDSGAVALISLCVLTALAVAKGG